MYDCVADHHDELTFSEGEVLVVLAEEDVDWWVSREVPLLFFYQYTDMFRLPTMRPTSQLCGEQKVAFLYKSFV